MPTPRAFLPTVLATACLWSCRATSAPDYGRALPPGSPALLPLGPDEPAPDLTGQWAERDEILVALENSLFWTRRPVAKKYFPIEGIDHQRAWLSLERLLELLRDSPDGAAFQRAVADEFQWLKSAGWDGAGGGVLFTGYCTPLLRGSPVETAEFRYPLYAAPPDLVKGPEGEIVGWQTANGVVPYPSRKTIEAVGMLRGRGLELAWLASPIDAYIAHVNGSAFLELADGGTLRLGYAGKNGRTYRSLGEVLIAAGEVRREDMNLAAIRKWAESADPARVQQLLNQNDSYVFFQPIDGNPHGSLDVEVSAGRSLATDKALFPRGAIVFVDAPIPSGGAAPSPYRRLLFDQDTGGAIRTAGRADIYFGIGPEAEQSAGRVKSEGQLYYLVLKPERAAALASSGRFRLPEKDPKWDRPAAKSAAAAP